MIKVKLQKTGSGYVAVEVNSGSIMRFRKKPSKEALVRELRKAGIRPALNEEIYVESV
jgi:hypothetical protein